MNLTSLIISGCNDDESLPWLEEHLQMAVAQALRQKEENHGGFTFASSLEGVKLSKSQAMRAKTQGMRSGEPDIRVYLPGGKIWFIELKRSGGVVSKTQKERHKDFSDLGHDVTVIMAKTPKQAVDMVMDGLNVRL